MEDAKLEELTLLLIRGVPGAGKTTLAESLDLPYCEADQYFELYNDGEFDGSLLEEAHEWCLMEAVAYLSDGESVIVSNTSTTDREVEIYADAAAELGARFVSIIVENRHGSSSIHPVPEMTVRRMKDRFSVVL